MEGEGKMVKVSKIYLISDTKNLNGESVDYKDIFKILWDLQYETRSIKNKTIQLCWEWNNFSADYKAQFDMYPKTKDIMNYSGVSGYAYDRLKAGTGMNKANFTSTIREAEAKWKTQQKNVLRGSASIINFGKNQPLELHNKSIKIEYDGSFSLVLSLLNKDKAKELNMPMQFKFKAVVKDNSTKTILERCYDGVYGISASKLIYDQKKKMWCINLSYKFEPQVIDTLNPDKILGVDLGVAVPIMASVYGDYDRLSIKGSEINHIKNTFENLEKAKKRKSELLEQAKYCGDGRIGHGYNTRCKPANNIRDKEKRIHESINHKYSKALIDYAVKKGCGTIQMENLTNVTAHANAFLKNWTYYNLQQKIEYKATEKGIKVVYVEPKYTSQRCSKCGCIHKENRPEQAIFKCIECGFEANADYNASQNIGIKDIDKIIDKAVG